MDIKNIFDKGEMDSMISRIHQLSDATPALWGKMNAAQMLAHCNVAYEMLYAPEKHPRPGAFARFFLKLFVKNTVVGRKPYAKNQRTGPQFIIEGSRNFNVEKKRLIDYMQRTQKLGVQHFEQKESHSLGKLTANEWNVSFSKHLDHHLRQFGV